MLWVTMEGYQIHTRGSMRFDDYHSLIIARQPGVLS